MKNNCKNINQSLCLSMLILMTSCQVLSNYNTVGFGPYMFLIQTSGTSSSLSSMGIESFYIGSPSTYKYLAILPSLIATTQPVILYKQQPTGFRQFIRLSCTDCISLAQLPIYNLLFNSDNTRLIVNYVNALRVYQISNNKLELIQKISLASNGRTFLSKDDRFLFVSAIIFSKIYELQSNGTYGLIYSTTTSAINVFPRAISPDGLVLIQNANQPNTTTLNLCLYFNATFSLVGSFDVGVDTNAIQNILIGEASIPNKYRIVMCFTNKTIYYQLITVLSPPSFTITVIQTIRNTPGITYTGYLTLNGLYLLLGTKTFGDSSFTILAYNSTTNNYEDKYKSYSTTTNYLSSMFVSQDASFIAVGSNSFGYYKPWVQTPTMFFLFSCNVTNCQTCQWINKCRTCNDGFVLVNNSCGCDGGLSSVNGTCVNCTISHCSQCNASLVCATCGNGFILSNNSCLCQAGRSISLTSNDCVVCNISGCLRCDRDNDCSVFSVTGSAPLPTANTSSSGNSSIGNNSISIQQKVDDLGKMMIIALAMMGSIAVVMVVLVIYYIKSKSSEVGADSKQLKDADNFNQIKQNQSKHILQTNQNLSEAQKMNPSRLQEQIILQEHAIKVNSQQQSILQPFKVRRRRNKLQFQQNVMQNSKKQQDNLQGIYDYLN